MVPRPSRSPGTPIPRKAPSEVEGGCVDTGDDGGDSRSRLSKAFRFGETGLDFAFAFSDPFRKGTSRASIDL